MHRLLLLPLLTGCALTAIATRKASWPELNAELAAPGITATATVARDEHGVPHIRAQDTNDLFYSIGFMHAQDRLFQADLTRRLAFGKLGEWRGEDVRDLDRFMAGLELRARAKVFYDQASPEVRSELDAYTRGLNAGAAALPALPVEYRLIGAEFEEWLPWDAMGAVWLNSWALAENPSVEVAAMNLRSLPAADMDLLFRYDPTEPAVGTSWDQARSLEVGGWTPEYQFFERALGGGDAAKQKAMPTSALSAAPEVTAMLDSYVSILGGSNNWIIGPSRSADGKAIVVNDPHLGQRVPSLWYPVEGKAGAVELAGMTIPGAPFIVLGHNQSVAWAFTNVMADFVDFAILQRDGEGYLLDGVRKDFRRVDVSLRLKGQDEPDLSVSTWTELGPVISDLNAPHVVVLQWHTLKVADRSLDLFIGLNMAKTVEDAIAAVSVPTVISQNLLVADANNFAWQPFGSFPNRVGWDGRLPYAASTPGVGVQGWLPAMPGERDPERGYVVTANSRPLAMPDAWRVSTHYIDDARFRRISELIESRENHDVQSVQDIQYDRKDLNAARILPVLLADVQTPDPDAARCLQILRDWDYVASPDSSAATVWAVFHVEYMREGLENSVGQSGFSSYLSAAVPGWSLLDRLQPAWGSGGGLDRYYPDRPKAVAAALDRSCTLLAERMGGDSAAWTWGQAHPLRLKHPFGGASALLKKWNVEDLAIGGTPNTVNAASYDSRDWPFVVGSVASMRLIQPLSDLSQTRFSHPGGSSGHPRHPHNVDLLPTWVSGATVPFWSADADVQAHTESLLTLTPPGK